MPPKDSTKQQRKTLYSNLVEDGYTLGSFAEFDTALADSSTRKTLFDNLIEDGYELGEYVGFEQSLGYEIPTQPLQKGGTFLTPAIMKEQAGIATTVQQEQPKISPLKTVSRQVKRVASNIGEHFSATLEQGKENMLDMVGRVKENGLPQDKEQAFSLYYGRKLEKLADEAIAAWKQENEDRELSEEQQYEAFSHSPQAKQLNRQVEQMALEFEGTINPMSKVAQLLPRVEQIKERREELSRMLKNVDSPYQERGYTAEEAELVKEREQLYNELHDIAEELSKPLELIADKGLKEVAFLYEKLDEESLAKRGYPLSKAHSRFMLERYGGGSKQDFDFLNRKELLEKAKNQYSRLKKQAQTSSENGFSSLIDGIIQNDWGDFFLLGLKSLGTNIDMLGIAKRAERGEVLSDTERYALQTYGLYQQLSGVKEMPATYDIGQSFVQSLPFMAEIALTGGLRSAVGKSVEGLVKRGLTKTTGKVAAKLATATAKGIGYTAGAALATPLQPITYKTLAERQLGNYTIDGEGKVEKSERAESLIESLGWANLSTFITLAAEDGMGGFAQGMKYAGKGIGKALGRTKTVKASSKLGSYLKNLQKNIRWNGFLQEVGEEYDEALLSNLLVPAMATEQDRMEMEGVSRWDSFFDPKQAAVIAGSIALTQVLMSSPAKVQRYYQTGKARLDLMKAQHRLPESISRRLVEALNMPDTEQQEQAVAAIDFSRLEAEDMQTIAKYMLAKTRYDILLGREQGKAEADKLDHIAERVREASVGTETVTTATNRQGKEYVVLSDNGSDGAIVVDGETGEKKMVARSELENIQEQSASELQSLLEQAALANLQQEFEAREEQELTEELSSTPEASKERPIVVEQQPFGFGDRVTADGKPYLLGNELDNRSWIAQDEKGREVVLSADRIQPAKHLTATEQHPVEPIITDASTIEPKSTPVVETQPIAGQKVTSWQPAEIEQPAISEVKNDEPKSLLPPVPIADQAAIEPNSAIEKLAKSEQISKPQNQQKERIGRSTMKIDEEQSLNPSLYSIEGIEHDYPNVEVAKQVKLDVQQFAKALAKLADLSYDTDKEGKQQICRVNLPPAGGEATIVLWSKINPEHGVYISIPYESHYGYSYDGYFLGREILWRTTERSYTYRGDNNRYVQSEITAKELAATIVEALSEKEKNAAKSKDSTASNPTFEGVVNDSQPLKTVDQAEVANNTNDHDSSAENKRSRRAIPERLRKDTGGVDDGKPAPHPSKADGAKPAQGAAGEHDKERSKPRERPKGNGSNSMGSGDRSHQQDSPTGRSNGDRLRTRRRTADIGTSNHAGETSRDNAPLNQQNYVIEDATSIVPKGEVTKIKANIAAIQLLKQLEQEVREATPEEKKILSQYSGWGGLSEVLSKTRRWEEGWVNKYKAYHDQLAELLTPDEYEAAINSTINAHYTSGIIVRELWKLAEHLGFSGGTVLEPAVGTGNFFGLIPKQLAKKSALRAYELDSLTGRIAAKLYPDAHIRVAGYESSNDRNIDLAISNVPFGQIAPYDKNHKELSKFSLHNYFIAKAIRQLAPNGIGIFISSASTMDSGASAKFREWVSTEGNADFIGAIRLPNTAFTENAGTTVTTDVLIFRKRDSGKPSSYAQPFRYTVPFKETVDDKGEPFTLEVNEYFAQNPSMMLGEMMLAHESTGAKAGGLYSGNDATLVPYKGQNLQQALANAIAQLPQHISTIASIPSQAITANSEVKEGTLVEQNGRVYEVENGELVAPEWAGKQLNNLQKKKVAYEQVAMQYLKIKGIASKLVEAEREDKEDIEGLRASLNVAYDAFVKEYGTFNENYRTRFIADSDLDYNSVFALELITKKNWVDESGRLQKDKEIRKSDIFTKRITYPVQEPTTAESLTDALDISIAYRGVLDLGYMAELTKSTPEAVQKEMLQSGLGFVNPATGLLEDKDSYLSGYVRTKYREAQAAAESNPDFEVNVRALKEVVPANIPATQIKVRLGSPFVDRKYIETFAYEKLQVVAKIQYSQVLGRWVVEVRGGQGSVANTTTYGTKRMTAISLLEKGLNLRQPEIFDTVYEGAKKTRVKKLEATAEAQTALFNLANEFESYIAESEEAQAQIEQEYNEQYNDFVEKQYSVPSLSHYPNASPDITLRKHQKVAVSRGLKSSLLLAHQVGTGKTFTMQTIAMEMRRLGIAKKPMMVVQNSTLEQFAQSFLQLYPSAKILAPNKKMMDAKNRQRLFSLIAYGDYDAIIIPQSFVDMIPDDEDRIRGYIKEQIAELQRVISELDSSDESLEKELTSALEKLEDELSSVGEEKTKTKKKTKKGGKVKDQAKRQLSITKRVMKQADRRTDSVLTFEKMGIDALLIDEAHAYKKLGFFTKMSRIKGVDTGRSKRAFGMFLKCRYVQERAAGNNVIFATGTPITNTMAELWTMMKFLSPDVLERYSITSFDEFASTFGSVEPSLEFTSTGSFKVVERFKSYINAPELLTAFRIKTHVVLTEDISEFKDGSTIPQLKDNDFTKVIIPQSEGLRLVMEQLKRELEEWEELAPGEKREKRHVPLVIFNQAKQAAIDLRLLNPELEDDTGSKTNRVIKEVKRIYDSSNKYKGTQLVFSDMFQSPENKWSSRFNLYQDIRKKLISLGIPEKEIAIIHDYEGEKRELLFKQVNSGELRVLLGSTERMGVGVNVQERLAALHHIDAPPRPMDFEQRNGRIQRQGNIHALMGIPIEVVTYGVEKTLDATAYQRLAIKQNFINQMMKGDNLDREVADSAEEDSPTDMTFDQMMSTLSGSQYAILHVQKSYELKKLEATERNFRRRQVEINRTIYEAEEGVAVGKSKLEQLKAAIEAAAAYFPNGKIEHITLDGVSHTEKLFTVLDGAFKAYLRKVQTSKNLEPLIIRLNGFDKPVELTIYNLINAELSYIFDVGSQITGVQIRPGLGLLSSIRSQLNNLEGKYAEQERRIAEDQQRIPQLRGELKKPFEKQARLEELSREVQELEELMQRETGGKKKAADESKEAGEIAITAEQDKVADQEKELTTTETTAANGNAQLVLAVESFTHTKTKREMAVAKLSREVDRDSYTAIASIASKHKGSWSKFAKGFLFDSEEDANAFRSEANQSEQNELQLEQLGFDPEQLAKFIGLGKGNRMLDIRGGAILQLFADREIYLKLLQRKILELGGRVDDTSDVYNDMTLSIGRATDRIQQYDRQQLAQLIEISHKVAEQVGSKWYWSETEPYKGEKITSYDAFELYLRAKDMAEAAERGDKDRGRYGFEQAAGVSPEAFTQQYEHKLDVELRRELWEAVRAATSFSIRLLNEAGMLTEEEYSTYVARRFYVPQRGWKNRDLDETIYKYLPKIGSPLYDDGYNFALQLTEGRTSLSSNPLPYIQSMAHTSVLVAERNRYKRKALQLVLDNIDIGRQHKLFDLRRTWYVSLKDANGNPVKDTNGQVIWQEVFLQPDKQLFEEDAHIRHRIYELRGLLMDAANRRDLQEALELKQAIEQLSERINVASSVNSTYTIFKTQGEANQLEVTVWLKNQQYVIIFSDERVANAINKADYESISGYLQNWFGKATRWMAAMATAKNPTFAVINFIRDYGFANLCHLTDSGLVYSGRFNQNVFNPKLHAAITRHIRQKPSDENRYDTLLRQFFADGSATGYSFLKDISQLKRKLVKEFTPQKGANPLRWTSKKVKALGDAFAAVTEYSELITRFATYLTSLEMGRSRHQAAVDAKNVTVNFNRKGTKSPMLNMFYLFFNATIQGGMRAVAITRRNKGKLAGIAASLALFGFLNTLFTMPDDDEEEYRKFSEYDRIHNVIIFGKKFPLPHFFRAFWGSGVQAAFALKGEKDAKEAVFDSFRQLGNELVLEQFNLLEYLKYNPKSKGFSFDSDKVVNLLPSMLKPFGEIAINRDFTGRTIYRKPYVNADKIPQAFWGKPDIGNLWQEISYILLEAGGGDRNIRKKYNVETGLYVSDWLDINPEVLEHLFSSYTGGVGRFFNDSYKTLENAAKGRFEPATVPVLNRFVKQYDEDKAFLRDYYQLLDRVADVEFAARETKKAIIGKNGERYDKALEEYKRLLGSKRYIVTLKAKKHLKKMVDSLNKLLEKIDEEKDREQLLKYLAKRTELMRKAKGYLEEAE